MLLTLSLNKKTDGLVGILKLENHSFKIQIKQGLFQIIHNDNLFFQFPESTRELTVAKYNYLALSFKNNEFSYVLGYMNTKLIKKSQYVYSMAPTHFIDFEKGELFKEFDKE